MRFYEGFCQLAFWPLGSYGSTRRPVCFSAMITAGIVAAWGWGWRGLAVRGLALPWFSELVANSAGAVWALVAPSWSWPGPFPSTLLWPLLPSSVNSSSVAGQDRPWAPLGKGAVLPEFALFDLGAPKGSGWPVVHVFRASWGQLKCLGAGHVSLLPFPAQLGQKGPSRGPIGKRSLKISLQWVLNSRGCLPMSLFLLPLTASRISY